MYSDNAKYMVRFYSCIDDIQNILVLNQLTITDLEEVKGRISPKNNFKTQLGLTSKKHHI